MTAITTLSSPTPYSSLRNGLITPRLMLPTVVMENVKKPLKSLKSLPDFLKENVKELPESYSHLEYVREEQLRELIKSLPEENYKSAEVLFQENQKNALTIAKWNQITLTKEIHIMEALKRELGHLFKNNKKLQRYKNAWLGERINEEIHLEDMGITS